MAALEDVLDRDFVHRLLVRNILNPNSTRKRKTKNDKKIKIHFLRAVENRKTDYEKRKTKKKLKSVFLRVREKRKMEHDL